MGKPGLERGPVLGVEMTPAQIFKQVIEQQNKVIEYTENMQYTGVAVLDLSMTIMQKAALVAKSAMLDTVQEGIEDLAKLREWQNENG